MFRSSHITIGSVVVNVEKSYWINFIFGSRLVEQIAWDFSFGMKVDVPSDTCEEFTVRYDIVEVEML